MFEPLEVKILRTAGWLWLKLVATIVLGALTGCSIADARMHDEPPPDIAAADVILPIPETEPLPPPVERPTESDPQPQVDTAPGGASTPVIYLYRSKGCLAGKQFVDAIKAGKLPWFYFEERTPPEWYTLCPTLHYQGSDGGWYRYPATAKDYDGWQGFLKAWQARNPDVHLEPIKGRRPAPQYAKKAPAAPYAMFDPDSRTDVWDGFFGLRRERLARKGKL